MVSRSSSTPHDTPVRPADAMLLLDRQLCFALYSSSLTMTKLYKPVLDPLGLTYPQYLVLLVLWETDAIGVGELGARLFLDSGTLTPLLKRMEAAGLLSRNRDAADERRVVVSLQPAGKALRRKARDIPRQVACASGCEFDELAELTSRLQTLRSSVSHTLDPRSPHPEPKGTPHGPR